MRSPPCPRVHFLNDVRRHLPELPCLVLGELRLELVLTPHPDGTHLPPKGLVARVHRLRNDLVHEGEAVLLHVRARKPHERLRLGQDRRRVHDYVLEPEGDEVAHGEDQPEVEEAPRHAVNHVVFPAEELPELLRGPVALCKLDVGLVPTAGGGNLLDDALLDHHLIEPLALVDSLDQLYLLWLRVEPCEDERLLARERTGGRLCRRGRIGTHGGGEARAAGAWLPQRQGRQHVWPPGCRRCKPREGRSLGKRDERWSREAVDRSGQAGQQGGGRQGHGRCHLEDPCSSPRPVFLTTMT
mmetsp:Transcript_21102/g.50905  ORF Transcript_21102/g.50905 Transcript_21102/m.50905 type:complete len:299 (+) Transcript_21102:592-1488(+)